VKRAATASAATGRILVVEDEQDVAAKVPMPAIDTVRGVGYRLRDAATTS
jgi:hypothetical protein